LSFAIPFVLTIIVLFIKAQYQISARPALGASLILTLFSLSENIEALAYITWPAWLLIGIGLRSAYNNILEYDIDLSSDNHLAKYRISLKGSS
jgi:hypothetical protein